MRKKQFLLTLLFFTLIFGGCAKKEPASQKTTISESIETVTTTTPIPETTLSAAQEAAKKGDYVVIEVFEHTLIRDNNLIDDQGKKAHMIFLPPSYYEGDQSYPVVYFFHGFDQNPIEIRRFEKETSALMKSGELKEMIIVGVSASNSLGGSFLENSPVTGLWEDSFVQEFIPYIDQQYRTIAKKEGRATTGFSMGGYICVNVAMKYPDLFNATYGMGPGMLVDDEINLAMNSWDEHFIEAYGSAFYPLPDETPHYTYPYLDGSTRDVAIINGWLNGFGHMEEKIDAYLSKDIPLAGIGIEVADNDAYPWITSGTMEFDSLLTAKNIEHTFVVNQNGHSLTSSMYTDNALGFLQKFLEN